MGCREAVARLRAGFRGVGGREGGRLGVGEALIPRWELLRSLSLSQPRRGNIYCKSRKLLITKLAGKGAEPMLFHTGTALA